MEATLQREREFSAANRVINVEYLVHILRKFLLAANPAERAKLIPILCQILHLRGDDAKAINDKWQVRGIVGWFQQTKANSKNSTNMDDFDGDKSLGTGNNQSNTVCSSLVDSSVVYLTFYLLFSFLFTPRCGQYGTYTNEKETRDYLGRCYQPPLVEYRREALA